MSYLVGSSTQKFIFLLTVKIHIDHGLGMLNTQTYSKSLGFHIKSAAVKHFKSISGTVSHSQHTYLGRNDFPVIYLNFL